MADLTFELKIDFGNIGGKKKLTFMSWNGNAPRYDIRDWYSDDKCGKGITLDKEELKSLYGILEAMFEEEVDEEVEDEVEETIEEETVEEQITLFDEPEETTEDEATEEDTTDNYPKEIQAIFKTLDGLFEEFTTEKAYGQMPFADGERIQYLVKKSDDGFPEKYNEMLEELGLKSFITDKGNLYIYTL